MTTAECADLMALMAAAYPNQTIKPATVEVYCLMLADMRFEDAKAAAIRAMNASDFFPSIALIRRCYDAIREEAQNRLLNFTGLADATPEQARRMWGVITYDDPPELPSGEYQAS